jgi:DNA repair protein RecO (recombination protein O)
MAVEWRDTGFVLSARPHGETSLVVSVLTRDRGRHMGLVRGGIGRAGRGLWQPGNRLHLTWKARLADHLGTLSGEMADALAARAMADADRLAVLAAVCAVAEAVLPEREPLPAVYDDTEALLSALTGANAAGPGAPAWGALYVRWERGLLTDLGFGLDLSVCAATGTNDGLVYVSPKSGRAVSASAGEPWRDRLLPLPAFLRDGPDPDDAVPPGQVAEGLRLTGYFLERHVFAARPGGAPAARARLVERVERSRPGPGPGPSG